MSEFNNSIGKSESSFVDKYKSMLKETGSFDEAKLNEIGNDKLSSIFTALDAQDGKFDGKISDEFQQSIKDSLKDAKDNTYKLGDDRFEDLLKSYEEAVNNLEVQAPEQTAQNSTKPEKTPERATNPQANDNKSEAKTLGDLNDVYKNDEQWNELKRNYNIAEKKYLDACDANASDEEKMKLHAELSQLSSDISIRESAILDAKGINVDNLAPESWVANIREATQEDLDNIAKQEKERQERIAKEAQQGQGAQGAAPTQDNETAPAPTQQKPQTDAAAQDKPKNAAPEQSTLQREGTPPANQGAAPTQGNETAPTQGNGTAPAQGNETAQTDAAAQDKPKNAAPEQGETQVQSKLQTQGTSPANQGAAPAQGNGTAPATGDPAKVASAQSPQQVQNAQQKVNITPERAQELEDVLAKYLQTGVQPDAAGLSADDIAYLNIRAAEIINDASQQLLGQPRKLQNHEITQLANNFVYNNYFDNTFNQLPTYELKGEYLEDLIKEKVNPLRNEHAKNEPKDKKSLEHQKWENEKKLYDQVHHIMRSKKLELKPPGAFDRLLPWVGLGLQLAGGNLVNTWGAECGGTATSQYQHGVIMQTLSDEVRKYT